MINNFYSNSFPFLSNIKRKEKTHFKICKVKICSDWGDYGNFYNLVFNDVDIFNRYDIFIILQPQEYSHFGIFNLKYIEKLNESLKLNNKYLIIFIGSEFGKLFNNVSNIKAVTWDSIDFFAKNILFTVPLSNNCDNIKNIEYYNYLKNISPTKYFTTMINIKNSRRWRIFIINELFKNKLNEIGNFSIKHFYNELSDIMKYSKIDIYDYPKNDEGLKFININEWNFKNIIFTNKKQMLIDKNCDFKFLNTHNYLYFENGEIPNNICDFDYLTCAFDIVMETLYDYFFVTEKTLRPIDAKKPFFVFSCVNFHSKLCKYGFKLYDIIDYSFDKEENTIIRWNMQIEELLKMKNKYSPFEIYNLTIDTVKYNYDVLNKIRLTKNFDIPSDYYDNVFGKYKNYYVNNNINLINKNK